MGEGGNRSKMSGRWEFEEKYLNEDGEGTLDQHVHVRKFMYKFYRVQWKEL